MTRTPWRTVTDAPNEGSLRAFLLHSYLECRRILVGTMNAPGGFLQAIVFPVLILLMFWTVLGSSVDRANLLLAGGRPSIYGYIALMSIVAAMSGSTVGALSILAEKKNGLISRMWSLPVHRAAGLAGRLLAETVRIFLTTVVLVLTGSMLGFEFRGDFVDTVFFFLVPILFGTAFAVAVTALSLAFEAVRLIEWIALISTLLMFFNSGFVPVAAYPEWLQPLVDNQPMSVAVTAMMSLSWLGSTGGLIKLVIWSVVLIAVFTWPAIWGFRRAAEDG